MIRLAGAKLAGVSAVSGLVAGVALASMFWSPRLDAERAGRKAEVAELRRQHEAAVREATEAYAAALEAARATEQGLRADIDRLQAEYEQERSNAQAEYDRVVADLRAGARRLSVAVAACPAGAGPAGADSTPAGRHQEARAELDPEAAERIVAIARDGDAAIRDLNACIDAYESVRRRINSVGGGGASPSGP